MTWHNGVAMPSSRQRTLDEFHFITFIRSWSLTTKAALFYSNSRRIFISDQPYLQKNNSFATEYLMVWRMHIHAYAHTHTLALYGKRLSEFPYVYSFNSAHLVHMTQMRFVGWGRGVSLRSIAVTPKRPEFSTVEFHFITPENFRWDTQLVFSCHHHTKLVCRKWCTFKLRFGCLVYFQKTITCLSHKEFGFEYKGFNRTCKKKVIQDWAREDVMRAHIPIPTRTHKRKTCSQVIEIDLISNYCSRTNKNKKTRSPQEKCWTMCSTLLKTPSQNI